MAKRKRSGLAVEAERRNREQLARLGQEVRAGRARRRLTQAQLGARVGLARSTIGDLERGEGGGHTLDTWQRIGVALDRPLRAELARDRLEETADAGHLGIQELVLRDGRAGGWRGSVELTTRPAEPWRSADVVLASPRLRILTVWECWNTIGDVGAAARSTNRKIAEASDLAIARFGAEARAAGCWVIRATARNRALVARYPALFAARFPGSSRRWLEALRAGREPPAEPGLVWATVDATRVYAWRRPTG